MNYSRPKGSLLQRLKTRILMPRMFGCIIFLLPVSVFGQTSMWTDISHPDPTDPINASGLAPQRISTFPDLPRLPSRFRLMQLNESAFRRQAELAQLEQSKIPTALDLPLPNGETILVSLFESPMMEPELAAKFPEIKTYSVEGGYGSGITGRLDMTPKGFHGMLFTPDGTVFIDPREDEQKDRYYISYWKKNELPIGEEREPFQCLTHDSRDRNHSTGEANSLLPDSSPNFIQSRGFTSGSMRRTYRLAVAGTTEYTNYHGNTVNSTLAAITTTFNRVNLILNRDMSIHLNLVADNNLLIYTGGDPYSYNGGSGGASVSTMLGENQSNIDTVIGSSDYDIGHVLGVRTSGGSGIATTPAICNNSNKARGVSASSVPEGSFDIELVAHEIGHQLAAGHTFNSTTGNCGSGNRDASSAVSPGGGTTILSYSGSCNANDIVGSSDAMFHSWSIDEYFDYISSSPGNSCGSDSSNSNAVPTANAGSNYTIPAETAFELTGSGSDPDGGDLLTYSWEQIDNNGTASNWDTDTGNNPLFRAFLPVTSPVRVIPRLTDLAKDTTSIGEYLPTTNRTMDFRLTVRDQNGGIDSDDMTVTVSDKNATFEITSHNSSASFSGGASTTVTWNVASTTSSPISCANVDILLSQNGGVTYPHTLASSTSNDGSQSVTLPSINSGNVRIKVKCSTSIFLDMNNADLTIGTPVANFYENTTSGTLGVNATNCVNDPPLTRTINVPDSIIIDDIQFGFNATHFCRGGIQADLTSPTGTTVRVLQSSYERDGSFDGDDDYDLLFDDDSTNSIDDGNNDNVNAPRYGDDRIASPDNPLDSFIGEEAQGNWTVSMCFINNFNCNPDESYNRSALYLYGDSAGPPPDFDNDGDPDSTDPDDDNDGASDTTESNYGTDSKDANDYPQPFSDMDKDAFGYAASLILFDESIALGCNATPDFCNSDIITRNTIARWLTVANLTNPPSAATTTVFTDIDIGTNTFGDGDFVADWIVDFFNENLTDGCNGTDSIAPTLYCPFQGVSKATAAKLLLLAKEGFGYTPPAATGSSPFADVDKGTNDFGDGDFAADWIIELDNRGHTQGCDGDDMTPATNFCPNQLMTKAGFANLLAAVYGYLPL